MDPFLFAASAIIGVLTAVDNYLYTYGVARIPHLDIGPADRNEAGRHSWIRVPAGEAEVHMVLNQHDIPADNRDGSGGDEHGQQPAGGGVRRCVVCGVLHDAWGAGALRFHTAAGGADVQEGQTGGKFYSLVLEIQLVKCFFATAFCTIGMLVNKGSLNLDPFNME
ncbi:uncharacterized protein J3R85_016904 [Psidium guajava]|nr:uncharacterized protein J3R85_016904 [Psidium guajava]